MTDKKPGFRQTRKRDDILATADRMFMQDGYKSVSMDAIADAVPVSKATLYNHFTDKKALYSAVVAGRCAGLAATLAQHLKQDATPCAVLTAIGQQFLTMITAPDTLRMHRSIIAEAKDFPELGRLFYESGPQQSHQMLARYLGDLHTAGQLDVPDAALSTALFFNALKGRHHMECLLGLRDTIDPAERDTHIRYAVALFLKAHAVSPSRTAVC